MRLIDANSILEEIIKSESSARDRIIKTDNMIGDRVNPLFIRYSAQLYERTIFKYMITDAPTVEAVPVRHGKWIEYNATGKKQWMCSECCAEEKNPKVARFCYWCGADMRGEQDG